MLVNPLFDKDEDRQNKADSKSGRYMLPNHKGKTIQPISKDLKVGGQGPAKPKGIVIPADPGPAHLSRPGLAPGFVEPIEPPEATKTSKEAAINLIRSKVAALYADNPDIKEELKETVSGSGQRSASKHQVFMQGLSTSGKPLAQIQTEWYTYYAGLPDHEKHEVWQEFYQANNRAQTVHATSASAPSSSGQAGTEKHYVAHQATHLPTLNFSAKRERRTKKQIKRRILQQVNLSTETQARAKEHFKSLLFGLSTGAIVLLVFLFSFFNEMIIAPFIQPSRHVSATPIILSSDNIPASATPEVIIPKINVQIPTVFDEKSMDEEAIQRGLERGVIHYPSTVLPGQQGNTVFFGHSSNNIFNKGAYKFAFVKLRELVPGDLFYLTYDKKVYGYRVYDKKIVPPSEVAVLNNVPGKVATATLITCDPPGTSTNRLVVWGEQISPDPANASVPLNPAPSGDTTDETVTELPSNSPTLWSRLWKSIF